MSDHLTTQDIDQIVAALRKEGATTGGLGPASKWIMTVAAVLLTATLGYQASRLTTIEMGQITLTEQFRALKDTVMTEIGDRFTGSDGRSLDALHKMRVAVVEDHVEKLDARVSTLEAAK